MPTKLRCLLAGPAIEVSLVSGGVAVDPFTSVESLQSSLFPVVVPASLETSPLHIKLYEPAPHTVISPSLPI